MSRTCNGRIRGRALGLSTTLLTAAGLACLAASGSALAQQAYNGGPNQVIVNMDVLNSLPGAYGGYGTTGAQPYGQPPKSQFLPGAAPQAYAPNGPVGAPRYLPPYSPYGMAGAAAAPLPLAPGLAGLATPPSSTPSSVLTTLGPDGRPIQPIKLKQPGSGTKQASKPKKKEYAAPAQPAPTETASAEPVPAPEPAPEATSEEQMATVEPPTPPAEPEAVPDSVPMPEATPAPDASGGIVETAPAVAAPEPPAEEPAQEAAVAPEAPAPEAPAVEAPEPPAAEAPAEPTAEQPAAAAPAEEAPAEETADAAPEEAPAPDNSQPAAPIPQGGIRIVFPTDLNDVPQEANAALDDLAGQMLADENMRIQIMCYASGTEETESKARRKSLARCINIRQYLFKKDVRTTRMDVRALGLKSEGQPADRVDIVPASS